MAGVGRAAVSSLSLCHCSSPQFKSASVASASSSFPFPHLIRLPGKSPPRLRLEHWCSTSSYPGVSFRFLRPGTNSGLSSSSSSSSSSSPSLLSLKTAADEEEARVESISILLLRKYGALCSGSLVFATAGAALAETIDITAPPESANEGTPTDYLLSFLFFAAFIGLVVVTAGVIYLGVTEFLENRQRTAMQKAAAEDKSDKTENKDGIRVGSGKGFGVRKADKKSEKDK